MCYRKQPRQKDGSVKTRLPPAEQAPRGVERSTPIREEEVEKPLRQPGQIDIGRLPGSSVQQ